jgi:hypothetical protein
MEPVAKGVLARWRLTPRYIARARGKTAGRRLQMHIRQGFKRNPPPPPAPSTGRKLLQRRDVQAGLVAAPVIGVVGGTVGYRRAKAQQEGMAKRLMPLTPQLEPIDKALHRHARKVLKEITTNGTSYQYGQSRKRGRKVSKAGFIDPPGFTSDVIRVGRHGKFLLRKKPKIAKPVGFKPQASFVVNSKGVATAREAMHPGSYALGALSEPVPTAQVKSRLSAVRVKRK